ncbi:hypothetical protein ACJEBK_15795 [Peribacillus frigoritolerans]|uniref:hypothetical protein n=1 Tax=Peribacillus frigoritolerans TaxID=450367 RepID=UPI003871E365
MAHPFHAYEEITWQQFILFIKSHNKRIEENINIHLNLEPFILEPERKMIQTLLESFLLFLSAPNIDDIKDTYEEHLDTWLQSHLPLLKDNHFSMFRLIFEKAIVTSLVNLKHAQTLSILMFYPFSLISSIAITSGQATNRSNTTKPNKRMQNLRD